MNQNTIMMRIAPVPEYSYPIKVASDLLEHPSEWLPHRWQDRRIVIITDDHVNNLYIQKLTHILKESSPLILTFAAGEKSKNSDVKYDLEQKMIEAGCDRQTIILALGGGVVGDMAGFVTATYLRGISYIQIPTTLLAMVDSSVGGKTSINLPQGKNLIGAFWQPIGVVVDMNFLDSLPEEHLINGLIEAIKMFATHDASSFDYLSNHLNDILAKNKIVLKNVIERAIQIKVNVVSCDEKETNQRMILNFGHTIGHALEQVTDYTILHGYAVALGILVESKLSQLLGHLSSSDFNIIQSLLLKLNISGDLIKKMDFEQIIAATYADKKVQNQRVRYILLNKIGQIYSENSTVAYPVTDDMILQSLIEVGNSSHGG